MFESLRDLFDSFRDEFRRSRGETQPLPLPSASSPPPKAPQPMPSRPKLPPAGPVDSTLAPLKNWAHPVGDKSDPLAQLTNLARACGGYYPLGRNGFWHGGVHFDAGTAGIVGIDQPNVHCLADGEVVAYRIDSRYPLSTLYTKTNAPIEAPFSTGFVLVRHRLQAPVIEGTEGAPPSLTFYSLYLHLQSWDEYEKNPGQARPVFWKAGTYRVKADAADPGPLGLPVYKEARAKSGILAVLPRGTRVTIIGHQGFVKLTSAQGIDLPRVDASSNTLGFVRLDALEACEGGYRVRDNAIGQTPGAHLNVLEEASESSKVIATLPRCTEVVISGTGDYRKLEAIQPAGISPESDAEDEAASDIPLTDSPPGPPLEKNQWDGTDFGGPKGYVRFSALEPIPAPQQFDRVIVPDPPIPIKAGQLIGHMGNVQNDEESSPERLLHLEVFSGDNVEVFIEKSCDWANKLPATSKTWLKLAKGTKVISHQASFKKDSPPTLQADGVESANDLLIPRSLLDGLRPESVIQVPAKDGANALNWYRLDRLLNSANYTLLDGWVCEEVGVTPWVSPWSWEGFECIYDDSSPRENLAYSMRAENELDEQQLERYCRLIEQQEKNPLQKRLYDLIPDGDCNGKMTARELQAGLRIPAVAQSISQLIIHYESEWFDDSGKWDRLDEMLGHSNSTPNPNWLASKERMRMFSWWREVAESAGLPRNGEVFHFHPIGLFSQLSPNKKDFRGKITFDAEGSDDSSSIYFSRVIHWPGNALSGVTLGRGYDMGSRSQSEIYAHLVNSGVSASQASRISAAHGLKGGAAGQFVTANRDVIGAISKEQQVALFELIYPVYVARAIDNYNNWTSDQAGRHEWLSLDSVIQDVLVDFVYQGFTKGPGPMRAGMHNNKLELIRYIENTPAISQYEPGRRRADYLRGN